MGKGKKKTSRKGKKAWRANISTQELDEYVERAAREERSGGSLDTIPNESLFFVDKSSDVSVVKKRDKYRAKVLHSDTILERASLVPPLLAPKKKIKKPKLINAKLQSNGSREVRKKDLPRQDFDIWSSGDNGHKKRNGRKKAIKSKTKRGPDRAAPAVDVDLPGCSFNPRFEDHQDALGLAVAQEMQKVYKKELEPAPIARMVPGTGTIMDEEDLYFLDVADDVEEPSAEEEDQHVGGSRPIKVKKLTRADLNKKRRRKEQMRAQAELAKRAKIQKDLIRLKEIKKDIDKEQEEKQKDWLRRTVSRQEKQAQRPPRLGKLRYEPEPMQILLSEEVTGSLRKLKGCYSLAKDRYNSLQQQGLIEPRQLGKRRGRKKRIEYEQGSKGHLEREMQGATSEMREQHPTEDNAGWQTPYQM